MAAGFAFVLMLFIALAFTVGLYLLIAGETSNPTVMDREQAEVEAKRRGGLQQEQNHSHHDPSERTAHESDTRSDHERATSSRSDDEVPRSGDSDTTDGNTTGWEFDHET